MPSPALDVRALSAAARVAAIADVVHALEGGSVGAIPGDTGYLICASATSPAGAEVARVAARSPAQGWPECAVWLAPDVAALLAALPDLTMLNRKVIRTLSPGPAVFSVHTGEDGLGRVRTHLGAGPGVVDDGRAVSVRVCGPSIGAAIASRVRGPIVSWEPADDRGRSLLDAGRARDAAMAVGIDPAIVLDEGAPSAGGSRGRPTVIALERSGSVGVLVEGAYESRYVAKQAKLNILFVCTGNTCRSPMAEAIASGLVSRDRAHAAAAPQFGSAGVGAVGGAPRTREGLEAVRALGFKPGQGSSRPLTRQLIAEADLIYAMTRSHLAGIVSLDPGAADKAALLDPSGKDIPDPIGLSQDAYNETAQRLERLIAERLKEWRS